MFLVRYVFFQAGKRLLFCFADESRSTDALCTLAVFMLTVSSCGLGFSCHGSGSGLEERSSLIPNYDIYI